MPEENPPQPQTPMAQPDGDPAATESGPPTPEQMAQAALAEASIHHPFGPAFFMSQLRGFAGEKCPDPAVSRPMVEIHLGDGERLDLCQIIGVTPQWVAIAVRDGEDLDTTTRLRTEFVPYDAIARVTLRASRPEQQQVGFEASREPRVLSPARPVMTPEESIRAAAAGTPEPRGD